MADEPQTETEAAVEADQTETDLRGAELMPKKSRKRRSGGESA